MTTQLTRAKSFGRIPSMGAVKTSSKLANGFHCSTEMPRCDNCAGVYITGVIKNTTCIILTIICGTSRNLAQTMARKNPNQKPLAMTSRSPIGEPQDICVHADPVDSKHYRDDQYIVSGGHQGPGYDPENKQRTRQKNMLNQTPRFH